MMRFVSSSILLAAVSYAVAGSVLDTAKQNGCAKLVSLINDAGLTSILSNAPGVTLFAPSDAAIDAVPADVIKTLSENKTLLQDVLKFHALPGVKMASDLKNDELLDTYMAKAQLRTNIYNGGKVVTAEGSVVSKANLKASNGVVHVIDKVIYPIPALSIPIFLTFDKDLNSLGFLAYQANLINKLAEQSFTVFAPSNEAVKKIPGQEYNNLLMNLTELTSVLTYHVVQGTVYSAALSDGQKVKTLEGLTLDVKINGGAVTINGAKVQQADLSTTNGVIHVIDTVLFPPKLEDKYMPSDINNFD